MDPHTSTRIHRHPHTSTDIHCGFLWIFVDPHLSTNIHIYPRGRLWIHIHPRGRLWIHKRPRGSIHKYPQKSTFIHNHPHKTRRSRTQNSHHHEQEDHRDRDGGEKWVGQLAKLSGTGGPPSGPGARGSASRHGPCRSRRPVPFLQINAAIQRRRV